MWARKGHPLTALQKTGYQNFYLYAATDPVKGRNFILELPYVDTCMIDLFLSELSAEYPGKKILLIWDGAGYHTSKELKIPRNIRIVQLPPYSPELNPVERLWRYIRRNVCHNRLYESLDTLSDELCRELRNLTDAQVASNCSCNYI